MISLVDGPSHLCGVLSFGLVSIPVELYSAIEDHNIRFSSAAQKVRLTRAQSIVLSSL